MAKEKKSKEEEELGKSIMDRISKKKKGKTDFYSVDRMDLV